jgi:hypothetical protein
MNLPSGNYNISHPAADAKYSILLMDKNRTIALVIILDTLLKQVISINLFEIHCFK